MGSSPTVSDIETALGSLFPYGTAVAAERIVHGRDGELWPDERAAVAGAVSERRAEFTAGRIAARRCLARLGLPASGLPLGPDRAAAWPCGVFGSISHTAGFAVAVAGTNAPLGVDLEIDEGLEADLWPVICSVEELAEQPDMDVGRWVRRIFSAKEAVFKAQEPANRTLFGFDAVRVRLTSDGFVASYVRDVGRFCTGQQVRGGLASLHGMIIAAATV